jgi:phosphate uptake regulator
MPLLGIVQATQTGGSSMRITLPKPWCRLHNITHGSQMQILEHGVLIIFPPKIDKGMDISKLLEDIRSTLTFLKDP